MWKIKTNKSVAKRFRVTKSGKLKHSKTCKSHLLTKKWKKTKRDKYGKLVAKVEVKRMSSMIPYMLR